MSTNYDILNRSPEDSNQIYTQLELPNRAPWLSAPQESIEGRSKVFPQGQLLLVDQSSDMLLASLSTNRIDWDGNPDTLGSWDDIAGDPTDYSKTYQKNGNTIVLMSMNINPSLKGKNLPKILLQSIKDLSVSLKVDYCIGSFRPNGFGIYKLENPETTFEDYIKLEKDEGLPLDGWLRNLTHNGMIPMKVDPAAMTVTCSIDEFNYYKNNYKPDLRKVLSDDVIICPETGLWRISGDKAVYKEKNLWGSLPLK